MKTTLSAEFSEKVAAELRVGLADFAQNYPGGAGDRQPVHVVYGGAHLFRADTATKLGRLAVSAFETYAPNATPFREVLGLREDLSMTIYERVANKLANEAIEDLRIDFEDGYGIRPDAEEDEHAVTAAREVANGMAAHSLPPFIGIRVKSLSDEQHHRSIRTLDLFLTTLAGATGGSLPENFVVTLPKVIVPEQVRTLAAIFDEFEVKLAIPAGTLKMEIMVETTQSIIGPDGRMALPHFVAAAQGRCRGAHFGAFDYTAGCDITSASQDLLHPACDFARHMMQVALGGTGVWLSDGATNIMPTPSHRGDELSADQRCENTTVVHRAWKLHYDHCRHSLTNGFYQGWDLHPAQLPTRYAAVYAFFLEGLDAASDRLRNFVEKAARATLVGDVFDDAATGQGLLNYFLRAINCGAITEKDALARTGLKLDELHSGSFKAILDARST